MTPSNTLKIGIVGCGVISRPYILGSRQFNGPEIVSCSDLVPAAAETRAREFQIQAQTLDAMLGDPGIDAILNLTIPASHAEISLAAIATGKHVYSEKPLGITFQQGRQVVEAAKTRGVRVGSAPDTFMSGSFQTARRLIDQDAIGRIFGGVCHTICGPVENWHPNPEFFYQPGAGPLMDMGPYYLTALVSLLGPVKRVFSSRQNPLPEREIRVGPQTGKKFRSVVDTHLTGLLEFVSGAIVQAGASFDAINHGQPPLELYGTGGTLQMPDTNSYGGVLKLSQPGRFNQVIPFAFPFADFDARGLGLADFAQSLLAGRPHRASGEMALHVLEAMDQLVHPTNPDGWNELTTDCERPRPMTPSQRPADLG